MHSYSKIIDKPQKENVFNKCQKEETLYVHSYSKIIDKPQKENVFYKCQIGNKIECQFLQQNY